jgi:RHS repeat-associated protein
VRRWAAAILSGAGALLLSAAPASAAEEPKKDKSAVSLNTISLPSGPGSIEGLGEAFQPMLNTGSARYPVKIALPRGTNGSAPELKLQYESGYGDGPLGIGWVYGPGNISRQVDKGLPRYVDGPNGKDDDGDGTVDEPGELDTFVGPDGEELVPLSDGSYRARIEGGFARFRRVGAGWEVDLKNGTCLQFGLTAQGRVAHPTGAKIFRWLLEKDTDANGNVVEYSWDSFAGSDGQKYLREIRYGAGAPPWSAFFFVYFTYETKPDWREDYRGGFLVKTAKRLARVEVGIEGVQPPQCAPGDWDADGTADALISRYRIEYDPSHPDRSFLAKVTRFGADGVNYLPPIRFGYAVYDPPASIAADTAVMDSENAPTSVMDTGYADLVDLNRDGLPDLLKTDPLGGAHTAYLNRGSAARAGRSVILWGDAQTVTSADGLAPLLPLTENRVHLADMDGDGSADLVHTTQEGQVFFFPNEGNVSWGNRRMMGLDDTSPPAPFLSNDVTTADMDFDKRMDTMLSTSEGYTTWFNLADGGYSRATRTPGASFQDRVMLFSDPGVQLADMNGDRLSDVVQVTPTALVVALAKGRGTYATAFEIPIPDTDLTGGPGGQVSRAKIADANGDGLDDLVLERAEANTLWVWLNRGNRTLSPRIVVTGLPDQDSTATAVRWADMNGNGTTDLVYADSAAASRLRVLDLGELLGGSAHPNLLVRIENGLGVTTTLTWRSSTELAVAAGAAGEPWTVTVPFPVQVVTRVETSTGLDVDATPGVDHYLKDLLFRDGFYEDRERAFRGFAQVTVTEPGDSSAPTRVTRHAFYTGGPDGEDNDGDGLVDEVSPQSHREEDALKGMLKSLEARTAAGAVLTRDENTWLVKTLVVGADGTGGPGGIPGTEVRFAYKTRSDRLIHEGSATPQETIRSEFAYDDFGNVTEERKYGALSIAGDEAFATSEYVNDTARWLIGLPKRQRASDPAGTKKAETLFYYDGGDFTGLPLGEATKGNLTRKSGWVKGGQYVDLARGAFDGFGNPVASLDPNGVVGTSGHRRTVAWDGLLHAFPVRETIEVGGGKADLEVTAEFNPGLGALTSSTDFNGHVTSFGYDTFGRLTSIVSPGDTALLPTMAFSYALADPTAEQVYAYDPAGALMLSTGVVTPSSVGTRAREVSGQPGTLDSLKYVDGLGRALASVSEGESGFVVSGAVRFNALGAKQFEFLPYAAGSSDYTTPAPGGAAVETRYDALGRPVVTANPPDALGAVSQATVQYLPLRKIATDEDGKVKELLSDGLERLVEVREHNQAATYRTLNTYDTLGNLIRVVDALQNERGFGYDGLSRRTLLEDPDRGRMEYAYDAAGSLIRRVDNKGQAILYEYDGANRLLAEQWVRATGPLTAAGFHYDDPGYPGATNTMGRLSWVEDLSGGQFFSYDSRGNSDLWVRRIADGGATQDFAERREYDAMGRPVSLTLPDGDRVTYTYNAAGLLETVPGVVGAVHYAPSGKIVRMEFANGLASDYSYDPRTRLTSLVTAPGAGSPVQDLGYSLDGVGNILGIQDRRAGVADPRALATEAFTYDDLHRLIGAQGDWGAIAYGYDAIGNMVSAGSPGAPDPQHVDDPLVNLGAISYGGAAGTSGRGWRAPGSPAGPHAVTATASGLAYAYDDNGNVTTRGADAYTWDFNDRMTSATVGSASTRFVYDQSGDRIIKEERNGAAVSATWYVSDGFEIRDGKTVKYVFAGDRRVAEVEGRLTPGVEAGQQRLALAQGWNLISFEVEPGNTSVAAVFAPIAGKWDAVYEFDATTQSWNVPTALHARRGYALHMTQSAELMVGGSAPATAVALSPGWNLVAVPSDNPVPPDEAYAAAAPSAVWSYDPAGTSWQVWEQTPAGGVAVLHEILPGRACWVLAGQAASIPFTPRPTKARYFHSDHLGGTAVVTDDTGAVAARNEYYPYGRLRYRVRAGFEPNFGFTGKEEDAETGLHYFEARCYDSVVGRFVSVDPLAGALGNRRPANVDHYGYARNNPTSYVDPNGMDPSKIVKGLEQLGNAKDAYDLAKIPFSKNPKREFAFFAGEYIANAGILALTGATGGASLAIGVGVTVASAAIQKAVPEDAMTPEEYAKRVSRIGMAKAYEKVFAEMTSEQFSEYQRLHDMGMSTNIDRKLADVRSALYRDALSNAKEFSHLLGEKSLGGLQDQEVTANYDFIYRQRKKAEWENTERNSSLDVISSPSAAFALPRSTDWPWREKHE